MSPVRLRGESVEKRYGRVAALRGVDFEIGGGESVALLGANGAGKSSLLKILAGLSRPSAGEFTASVEDAAVEYALDRSALRARVGYVGHATLVYGELSARENLAFAARLHGKAASPERLDALLADFALADVADRRAGTFSRGMAQRLAIARSVVHAPSMLLLDEPFTGLDELSAEGLTEQLARLRHTEGHAEGHTEGDADDRGRRPTLVLVTHDPRRAVALTDRALVLHRGRICATPSRAEDAATFTAEGLAALLVEIARQAEAAA